MGKIFTHFRTFFLFFIGFFAFFPFFNTFGQAPIDITFTVLTEEENRAILDETNIKLDIQNTNYNTEDKIEVTIVKNNSTEVAWSNISSQSFFEAKTGSQLRALTFKEPADYKIFARYTPESGPVVESPAVSFTIPKPTLSIAGPTDLIEGQEYEYTITTQNYPPSTANVTANVHVSLKNAGTELKNEEFNPDSPHKITIKAPNATTDQLLFKGTFRETAFTTEKLLPITVSAPRAFTIESSNPNIFATEFISFQYNEEDGKFPMGEKFFFRWKATTPNQDLKTIKQPENGAEAVILPLVLEKAQTATAGEYKVALEVYDSATISASSVPIAIAEKIFTIPKPEIQLQFSTFADKSVFSGTIVKGKPVYFDGTLLNYPRNNGRANIEFTLPDKSPFFVFVDPNSPEIPFGNTPYDIGNANTPAGLQTIEAKFKNPPADFTDDLKNEVFRFNVTLLADCEADPTDASCNSSGGNLSGPKGQGLTEGACIIQQTEGQHEDPSVPVDINNDGQIDDFAPIPPIIAGSNPERRHPCFCFKRLMPNGKLNPEWYRTILRDEPDGNGNVNKRPVAVKVGYCVAFAESIGGETSIGGDDGIDLFSNLIRLLYVYGASLIGLVSVLIIVVSGIQMTTTGMIDTKEDAKNRIFQALLSMVLLFMSAAILRTVNPDFFRAPNAQQNIGTDTDADKIPDAWEKQYNLDPLNPFDALEDFDADGKTNLEEYLNGTDPFLS